MYYKKCERNMIKKIITLISIFLILPNLFALQMLEPVMTNIEPQGNVEIGVVAPGEYFLISFLLDEKEKYDLITTDSYSSNYISFENIENTTESIFAIAKINENARGEQKIKVVLKNSKNQDSTEIYLGAKIETNVISTFVLPFEKNTEFGKIKDVKIKVINKSITTKKITVSSNLPVTWFESKEGLLDKEKTVFLQPAGTTEVTYSFVPKSIGEKEIELYIYTDIDNTQLNTITPNFLKKIIYERNEELITIYVVKNLSAVYGSNLYNFPTFGLNSIPVYFFNNVIRIITN